MGWLYVWVLLVLSLSEGALGIVNFKNVTASIEIGQGNVAADLKLK